MDVLLNWIGQGGVVALAAAAVLRVIPRSRTQARYSFAWAASVVVLGLPAVPHVIAATFPALPVHEPSVSPGPVVSMPLAWWTSTALAIGLCIVWSGCSALRFAVGAVALRETRRQCRDCPSTRQARLQHWSRVRATGRRARLVLSTGVRSAAVLGCGAPVIAIAPGLLEQLSDEDLDRVVMHEWAHVQRYDDVAQVVERVVRMVAGWHPAVWWLQRQLQLEREVACDEIAVALTGSAKKYAACLVTLAALRLTPVRALPALAAVSSSGLRRRLARMLVPGGGAPVRRWHAMAISSSLALASLSFAVGNVQVVESVTTALTLPAAARPATALEIATPVAPVFSPTAQASSAMASLTRRRSHSGEGVRPAPRESEPPGVAADTARALEPPPTAAVAALPSQSLGWLVEIPISSGVAAVAAEAPANAALTEAHPEPHAADPSWPPDEKARRPWVPVADAAVAVGRRSQDAGVAAAGFFSRFGKQIAGSF